jgi:hypothetical protein
VEVAKALPIRTRELCARNAAIRAFLFQGTPCRCQRRELVSHNAASSLSYDALRMVADAACHGKPRDKDADGWHENDSGVLCRISVIT